MGGRSHDATPRTGVVWAILLGQAYTRAGNLPGCRQDQANAGKGRSNQGCQAKVNIIYIMGHSPMRPTALKRRPGRIGTRTHGGLPHSLRNIGNHAVPPQTIGRRPADLRQAAAAGRILFCALQPPALRAATMRSRIVDCRLARTSSSISCETMGKDALWHLSLGFR